MIQYFKTGDNMTEILTKCGKCFCCGETCNYDIYDIDEQINLENYNLFKNPLLHVCNNCGYIFYDLDTPFNQITKVENDKFFTDQKPIYLATKLLETNLPLEVKLRLYACIFDDRKLKLSRAIRFYLEDPTEEDKQKLFEFKKDFKHFCQKFLNFLNKNTFDENVNKIFVKLLGVEILSAIGNVEQAKQILDDTKLEKRLDDFMKEVVMIGDITCCNL